jgi:hypothetical protein
VFLKCGSDLKYPSTLKDKDPSHLEEFSKRNFHKYKVPFKYTKGISPILQYIHSSMHSNMYHDRFEALHCLLKPPYIEDSIS